MNTLASILTGFLLSSSTSPITVEVPPATLPLEPTPVVSTSIVLKPIKTGVPESLFIPFEQWVPEVGDRFIADTERNIGYIVHPDGTYTSQLVGSGRRRNVSYMGKYYNATTPEDTWTVESTTIQGDKGIFGKTGLFLRLSNSTGETSYGIHSTGNIDDILADTDRYMSMGCILVSDALLEVLHQTYLINGQQLRVETSKSVFVPTR